MPVYVLHDALTLAQCASQRNGNHRTGSTKNATDPGIEQEYISNLQKQVYFLELESKLLREKANRNTLRDPNPMALAEGS